MTKDEIKAYAADMIELAKIDGPTDGEMRTRIVQQVIAVCGMPVTAAEIRQMELARGAGALGRKVN